jgi:hypothetical protein
VSQLKQVTHGLLDALAVFDRDRVVHVVRIAVEKDGRHAQPQPRGHQVAIAVARRGYHQPIDTPLRERIQDLEFALRLVVIAGQQRHVPGLEKQALRDIGEADESRRGEVANEDADRVSRLPPHALSHGVRRVAQLLDRPFHPALHLRIDVRTPIDDARCRTQ